MDGNPVFRYYRTGELLLKASHQSQSVSKAVKHEKLAPKSSVIVEECAKKAVAEANGDIYNVKHVYSKSLLQFGKYYGQSFQWVLENDIGWAVHLISSTENEREKARPSSQTATTKNREDNKTAFINLCTQIL